MPQLTDIPPPSDTSLTFAEGWSLWLAYRSSGSRPMRASTRADYDSIYSRHLQPAFGQRQLAEIDGLAVARFSIALGASALSPKRVANVLVPLRACLRWQHRIGTLAVDPTPWFDASAPAAGERLVLTPPQIEALLVALPPPYRPMIAFAAYTGVRAGELRALTWGDVDLERGVARIDKTLYRDRPQHSTKTGRDRVVPVPPHVVAMLAEWRRECPEGALGLVFPNRRGRPLDLDVFRARVFKPAVRRAGLPERLRIHDLRHTSATLYLRSGATVREVMEIHGWTQLQTAMRYLHADDSLAEAARRLSESRARALSSTEEPP